MKIKRVIAFILALTMVFGLLPGGVAATEAGMEAPSDPAPTETVPEETTAPETAPAETEPFVLPDLPVTEETTAPTEPAALTEATEPAPTEAAEPASEETTEPETAPAEEAQKAAGEELDKPAVLEEPAQLLASVSLEDMPEINAGETAAAVITSRGGYAYFKFTPQYTESYTFYSTDGSYTHCYLYDSEMNHLKYASYSSDTRNFSITYDLEAGQTYVWAAGYYYSYDTGAFTVALQANHTVDGDVITTPATCTTDGLKSFTCIDCGPVTEVIPAGHTYENDVCTMCGITGGKAGALEWTLDGNGKLTVSGSGPMTTSPWSSYNDRIVSVEILEGVSGILNDAFEGCANLKTVKIGPDVANVYAQFYGCSSLTSFQVDAANAYFSNDAQGVLLSKDQTALHLLPTGFQGVYTVPANVTTLRNSAFSYCKSLTGVVMHDGVTELGTQLFNSCSALTDVTLPSKITAIPRETFMYCSSLVNIQFPASLTSIGYNAFYRCTSLVSITIPEGVKSIADNAFRSCSALKTVNLPDSLTAIGNYAFGSCASLETINIPDATTSIGSGAFQYCSALKSVVIPEGTTSLHAAFIGCESLEAVTIPDTVTSFGYWMFKGCNSLASIDLPDNLTSIGVATFENTALTKIEIPANVKSIATNAFNTDTLKEITFIGDAPSMAAPGWNYFLYEDGVGALGGATATAYFPSENATWTETVIHGDYGGNITWKATAPVHVFPYSENKANSDLAETLSLYSLLIYKSSAKNSYGRWVTGSDKGALGDVLRADGYQDMQSYYLKGSGSGYIAAKKTKSAGEHTSPFVIGHRRVNDGDVICDQLVIIFRGTYNEEWYGNFDVTGMSYNSAMDTHLSFQQAADNAMQDIAAYIHQMEANGRLSAENLKIVLTGHSRGAAVANLLAHQLTDIKNGATDGAYYSKFADIGIGEVYAYTFATPNVATVAKIQSHDAYDNIFNYCFTDDFVPNLPLECWSWGKYGKTYWATAAKLINTSSFDVAVWHYYGETPTFSTVYTDNISATMRSATGLKADGLSKYYNNMLATVGDTEMNLHLFVRHGLGGVMQSEKMGEGAAVLLAGAVKNSYFRSLAWNLVIGGKINDALNDTHQAGTYYAAMTSSFGSFKESTLEELGYDATTNAIRYPGTSAQIQSTASYSESEVAALQEFLQTPYVNAEYGIDTTNAALLGVDAADVSTWDFVTWTNGSVTILDLSFSNCAGTLDLADFPSLSVLDCRYCNLSALDPAGSTSLTELYCSGNQLTELDLTGVTGLTMLECANNQIGTLDLSACTGLTRLDCGSNQIRSLDLSGCGSLNYLVCTDNYLDANDTALQEKVAAINASDTGYAEFGEQNIPAEAVFAENDLNCLLAIANTEGNQEILGWDLEAPISWSQVRWVCVDSVYYLKSVDFTGLGLTGEAVFDNCTALKQLFVSDNGFTSLSVYGCSALKTLWCERNYLNTSSVQNQLYSISVENIKLTPQRSGNVLNAADEEALKALIETYGLHWDTDTLRYNEDLTWTQSNGEYILTGMDLTDTAIAGEVDLSCFANMTHLVCRRTGVTSLVLPNAMTSIAASAFEKNEALVSVTLPESLTTIGSYAFYGCSALESITVSKTVTSVGAGAFGNCTGLAAITFNGDAPAFTGDLVFENVTATVYYPVCDTWTEEVMLQYGGTLTWTVYEIPVEFVQASVSPGGDIGVNFYVTLSDAVVNAGQAYMQFSYSGNTQRVYLSNAVVDSSGNYVFACKVAAKNMADVITAQMFADGVAVGESKTYSVRTYCDALLGTISGNTDYALLETLLKAMLNYGAYAQLEFGHNTGDLANANLTAEDQVLAEPGDLSAYAPVISGTDDGISVYSASLSLNANTTIRYYFQLTGDKTVDEYTFTVNGVEVTPVSYNGSTTLYIVDMVGVSAKNLDEMYIAAAGDTSVSFSGLSYVKMTLESDTADGDLQNVAKALYAYNQAANAYFSE